MRLNTVPNIPMNRTHEGGPAKRLTPYQTLRRSVLACLLWEDTFYEDGQSVADRIIENATKVTDSELRDLSVEARSTFNLRHVPLLLLMETIRRGGSGAADVIAETIQRADEITEVVAMYWRDRKRPLTRQMKVGLAKAMNKFDEYQFGKYDRPGAVRFRDVLFLTHAKPKDEETAALFKRIADKAIETPDTWETRLSGGADKKDSFTELLKGGKLGYMALLRNLRNMSEAGVDENLIKEAIIARKGAHRVLPFRYVAAARTNPQYDGVLDQAMTEAIADTPAFPGRTIVAIDTSASMTHPLSAKSQMQRVDAAATLGAMINGDVRVLIFATGVDEIPARRGLAGVDAVKSRIGAVGYGTDVGSAVRVANSIPHDRLIVISDEQTRGSVPDPIAKNAYMINVGSYENGIGYGGRWTNITGFSEATIRYMREIEAS